MVCLLRLMHGVLHRESVEHIGPEGRAGDAPVGLYLNPDFVVV